MSDIRKFYDSLDQGIKNKLKTCKSGKDVLTVLGDAGVDLDPSMLQSVNGGVTASYSTPFFFDVEELLSIDK